MRISDNWFIRNHRQVVQQLTREDHPTSPERMETIAYMLKRGIDQHYLLTAGAIKLINKIDADKMPYTAMMDLPDQIMFTILHFAVPEQITYVIREGAKVTMMTLLVEATSVPGQMEILHGVARFDVVENYIHGWEDKQAQIEFEKEFRKDIAPILAYIFMSDVNVQVLEINASNGKSRKAGKVLNDSENRVAIVGEKWNDYTISIGDFAVGGHYRMQPYGENRSLRKLIYIKPFVKHGYRRRNKR